MKLYIAGEDPGANYAQFMEAERLLRVVGYDTLNPARIDEAFPKADGELRDWKWYMCRSIPMVCQADGIAVLLGWARSRGTKFQVMDLGSLLEIPMATVENWIEIAGSEAVEQS